MVSQKKTENDQSEAVLLATIVLTERLTIAQAANRLKWSTTTAYRVSRSSEYRSCLSAMVRELSDRLLGRTYDAADAAITTLIDILKTGNVDQKLSAARTLINQVSSIHALASRQQPIPKPQQQPLQPANRIGSHADLLCEIWSQSSNPERDNVSDEDNEIDELYNQTTN